MDITPAVKIAGMAALGYVYGLVFNSNEKMIALTWAIAEIAMQIFKFLDPHDKNHLEPYLRVVIGGATCIYLSEKKLISRVAQAVLCQLVFSILPEIMQRVRRNPITLSW